MTLALVFTDLDGTLLDHDTYSWEPARPALERMRKLNVPLILNSSKTVAELELLHRELGLDAPYVAENGAVVCLPDEGGRRVVLGVERADILAALEEARREHGWKFRGFAEMSDAEVAGLTGLAIEDAARARQREGSEPLVWQDQAEAVFDFAEFLARAGLTLTRGGRFLHVLGQADKARAMLWLRRRYLAQHGKGGLRTVAAGDSPNDASMLRNADIAVVIPHADGVRVQVRGRVRTMIAPAPGPAGWNACMMELLDQHFEGTDHG
jgi:mannosyl-3-phosphoglycerate phosphatase